MRKGFTLIEVIVALSLSAAVLLAGTFVFSSAYRTYKFESKKSEHMQIEQAVLVRIEKDCRSALKIDLTESRLTINSTKYYELKDKKVHMQDGSHSSYLTDVDEIKNLKFRQLKPNLMEISIDSSTTEVATRNE